MDPESLQVESHRHRAALSWELAAGLVRGDTGRPAAEPALGERWEESVFQKRECPEYGEMVKSSQVSYKQLMRWREGVLHVRGRAT